MGTPLGAKYIPYTYMDPLGTTYLYGPFGVSEGTGFLVARSSLVDVRPFCSKLQTLDSGKYSLCIGFRVDRIRV